jgi:peptidoglycan/LPS O-acetylase OafA/YrhL
VVRTRLGYVPALDGLRGIAILLVVAVHYTLLPIGGVYGVDLFFVLSGFLITTLLLEELSASGRIRLRAFYARRARRLFPALAVLLLAYLLFEAARGVDGLHAVAVYGLYAGNVYQAVAHTRFTQTGLEHLWSLAEEEQFYLVWPAVLLVLTRVRRPVRWLAALFLALASYRIALIFHGANVERIGHAPDTRSEGLVLGSLVAYWRPQAREWLAKAAAAVALLLVLTRDPIGGFSLPLFELAAAGLVVSAVGATELARGLSWRPLVQLGKISYSLYLWHLTILWAFGNQDRVVALLLSVAAACASYRFVEQPFRRRRLRVEAAPSPA